MPSIRHLTCSFQPLTNAAFMNRFNPRLANAFRAREPLSTRIREASSLRQRAVVSSFICTSPESSTGFTFALFKRSKEVRAYPGKWAVCSGSIDSTDPNPQFAAAREIAEETTLITSSDITLLRRGRPFSLVDSKLNTEWTIHPFAWKLKSGAKPIKLDWEHTDFKFITPDDLANYDHVPQLEIGLKRVLVSSETEKALKVLKDDNESGGHDLPSKALNLLLEFANGEEMAEMSNQDEFWRELRMRAWHLANNAGPSMNSGLEADLFKVMDSVRAQTMDSKNTTLTSVKTTLQSAIASRLAA